MKPTLVITLTLFSIFFVLTCSNPQKQGPTETASAFLDALAENDYDKAKSYCTPSTADKLDMAKTVANIGLNPYARHHTIVGEEVSGDYAKVYYEFSKDEEQLIKLRNTSGKWEVIASKDIMGTKKEDDDNDLDLDFGNLDEEMDDFIDDATGGLKTLTDSLDDLLGDLKDIEITDPNKVSTGETYLEYRIGKSPEEIAEAFLTAKKNENAEEAKRYISEKSVEVLDMQVMNGGFTGKDFIIQNVEKDGKYRKVFYVEEGLQTETQELKLGPDSEGNWEVILSK